MSEAQGGGSLGRDLAVGQGVLQLRHGGEAELFQDVDTVTLQPGSAFLISSAAALAGVPLRVSVLRFLNFLSTGTTDERPGARMPSSACRSTDTRSRGANTAQTIGQPVAHRPHFP